MTGEDQEKRTESNNPGLTAKVDALLKNQVVQSEKPEGVKFRDTVRKYAETQLTPPHNPAVPNKHVHQKTISLVEFLADIEEALIGSITKHPDLDAVQEAMSNIHDLKETATKVALYAYITQDGRDQLTMLTSRPNGVELHTGVFNERNKAALDSALKIIPTLTYEQQPAYNAQDPLLNEKITDFEAFKKDLIAGIVEIRKTAGELSKVYNDAKAAEKNSQLSSGASPDV